MGTCETVLKPYFTTLTFRLPTPNWPVALSVWRALERQPFFVALVAALESHLGPEVAALQRAAGRR